MSDPEPAPSRRAAELRHAFDAAFAQPTVASVETASEGFLLVRIDATGYALRLSEIAGVFAGRKIVPLPSTLGEQLGLTAVRGAILPVYDLGALLGRARASAPRWLAVTASTPPLALAFDALERHARVALDALAPASGQALGDDGALSQVLRAGDTIYPVVRTTALIDALARRLRSVVSPKEG